MATTIPMSPTRWRRTPSVSPACSRPMCWRPTRPSACAIGAIKSSPVCGCSRSAARWPSRPIGSTIRTPIRHGLARKSLDYRSACKCRPRRSRRRLAWPSNFRRCISCSITARGRCSRMGRLMRRRRACLPSRAIRTSTSSSRRASSPRSDAARQRRKPSLQSSSPHSAPIGSPGARTIRRAKARYRRSWRRRRSRLPSCRKPTKSGFSPIPRRCSIRRWRIKDRRWPYPRSSFSRCSAIIRTLRRSRAARSNPTSSSSISPT